LIPDASYSTLTKSLEKRELIISSLSSFSFLSSGRVSF